MFLYSVLVLLCSFLLMYFFSFQDCSVPNFSEDIEVFFSLEDSFNDEFCQNFNVEDDCFSEEVCVATPSPYLLHCVSNTKLLIFYFFSLGGIQKPV